MIRKHDDLVGSLLHDVAHFIRLRIDRKLKNYGLTRVKWLALGVIQRTPSITQGMLARELELGDAATGRLVDRLVIRGFVSRHPDPKDRRVRQIVLTPKATKLLSKLQRVSTELRQEILDGIAEEELLAIGSALKKMKSNLRALGSAAIGTFFYRLGSEAMEFSATVSQLLRGA